MKVEDDWLVSNITGDGEPLLSRILLTADLRSVQPIAKRASKNAKENNTFLPLDVTFTTVRHHTHAISRNLHLGVNTYNDVLSAGILGKYCELLIIYIYIYIYIYTL